MNASWWNSACRRLNIKQCLLITAFIVFLFLIVFTHRLTRFLVLFLLLFKEVYSRARFVIASLSYSKLQWELR